MKIIKITHGKETLVDDQDFEYLNQFKWHFRKDGYASRSFRKNGELKTVMIHRIILNLEDKNKQIDHKNRNKLDNRKENLRICNASENRLNIGKYKSNKSGFTGVYWHKRDLIWIAQISINNKQMYLGSYKNKEAAAKAYQEALKKNGVYKYA